MKILFNVVLILSFLFEALASVSLITGPEGISAAGSGNQWSMHYGFAVFPMGLAIPNKPAGGYLRSGCSIHFSHRIVDIS